jgi:hypothetical protein
VVGNFGCITRDHFQQCIKKKKKEEREKERENTTLEALFGLYTHFS